MSVISGIWGAEASKSAADTQAKSAEKAAQVQWQMYNQTRADQAPFREAGAGAVNALWGTGGTSTQGQTQGVGSWTEPEYSQQITGYEPYVNWDGVPMQRPIYGQVMTKPPQFIPQEATTTSGTPGTPGLIQQGPGEFKESEGYQWTLGQGLQAQQRQASSTGRLGSGAYLKDATKYAEGLASTEYDNFLRRYYQSLDPYFRMAGYGSNMAMTGGNQAIAAGNALANTYGYGGAAQAAGIMGAAQSGTNALRNVGQQAVDYFNKNGSPWSGNGAGAYAYGRDPNFVATTSQRDLMSWL